MVTKPLEQSLSTIDGVKTITSTSSDNYSMLTLEFEDGTNMDTATVDMRGNLDTIKDAWPDGVGSPYLMKINPNMMPVAMVAVDYDGYDTVQISDYVNNELKNQLEGIDGVASVSTKGIVTQKENVIISQTKIDALNAKSMTLSMTNSAMRKRKFPMQRKNCRTIFLKRSKAVIPLSSQ